jgi:hypothetical protein
MAPDDNMIAALKRERAGYVARGEDDRVAQVDEQLQRHGYAPAQDAVTDPDGAPVGRTADPGQRTAEGGPAAMKAAPAPAPAGGDPGAATDAPPATEPAPAKKTAAKKTTAKPAAGE